MDLGCGITLDIFTHVFTRVLHKFIIIPPYIQKKNTSGDLGEGYNVELKKDRFIAHNIIRNVHKNYAKGLYRDSELLEDKVSYAGLGSAGS